MFHNFFLSGKEQHEVTSSESHFWKTSQCPFSFLFFQNTSFSSTLQEITNSWNSVYESFINLSSYINKMNSDSCISKENLKMWTTVENMSTEVRPIGISIENCGYQVGNLNMTRGVLVMKNLRGKVWYQVHSGK